MQAAAVVTRQWWLVHTGLDPRNAGGHLYRDSDRQWHKQSVELRNLHANRAVTQQ
jgi:hypothetical protein